MRRGDGLAYDPARDAWRRLPPPPRSLPASAGPALWTGRELLVVDAEGGRPLPGAGSAAPPTIPVADRWRSLAPSPRLGGGQLLERTVLWAGTRLLVWSFWTRPGGPAPTSADPDGVELWAYRPLPWRAPVRAGPPRRSARSGPADACPSASLIPGRPASPAQMSRCGISLSSWPR